MADDNPEKAEALQVLSGLKEIFSESGFMIEILEEEKKDQIEKDLMIDRIMFNNFVVVKRYF